MVVRQTMNKTDNDYYTFFAELTRYDPGAGQPGDTEPWKFDPGAGQPGDTEPW